MKKLWLTPHIMEDEPNTISALKERFNELMSEYRGNMTIRLASEDMMDSLLEERLQTKDLLQIGENHEKIY